MMESLIFDTYSFENDLREEVGFKLDAMFFIGFYSSAQVVSDAEVVNDIIEIIRNDFIVNRKFSFT